MLWRVPFILQYKNDLELNLFRLSVDDSRLWTSYAVTLKLIGIFQKLPSFVRSSRISSKFSSHMYSQIFQGVLSQDEALLAKKLVVHVDMFVWALPFLLSFKRVWCFGFSFCDNEILMKPSMAFLNGFLFQLRYWKREWRNKFVAASVRCLLSGGCIGAICAGGVGEYILHQGAYFVWTNIWRSRYVFFAIHVVVLFPLLRSVKVFLCLHRTCQVG